MEDHLKMAGEPTDNNTEVEGGEQRGDPSPDQLRTQLEEEFNMQRARMKELFLQKEVDTRKIVQEKEELESEVVGLRAQLQQLVMLSENQSTELQNLQLVIRETVEESSSSSDEARRLRARNVELEMQLQHLNQQVQRLQHAQQQQELAIAPATFVRSLARKLTADTDEPPPTSRKPVEEDESIRSDSGTHPRELEIAALKNKLRETDARLQDALAALKSSQTEKSAASGDNRSESASTTEAAQLSCDMCRNYEKQLVAEQRQCEAARDRSAVLDAALKVATEELEGIRSIHDETVRSWHDERASSSQQLEELKVGVEEAQRTLDERVAAARRSEQDALERVTMLTVDREMLQRKLDSLEKDNAILIGQYTKAASEMQNEMIDLPDNIEDLQVCALQLREQLIFCQIGRENALEGERELRNQMLEQSAEFHRQEQLLMDVHTELQRTRDELDRLQTEREQMKELGDKLRNSSDMIERLLDDKKRLQGEVCELRARVSALQQELDNSEKVQQDFVRLSQSLQVQLQRIREADTEVRWQHDDDVSECPSCHTPLPNNKKKVHCRHCGRIYCGACVSHTVCSGPRGAAARVCAVCRTLLQPHTAPYFSTQPPHTPD